eukprot:NODE_3348_length_984_cov_518.432905_g3202_i0.p1 GENE.NODE_3348_length_984_cov_518.432905_g3202_i0~~NODE_3348_length_984_cov_518.432905_g3202_i0.p1  ORF type:complete len:294 (-),score=47.12 NODE_3348_length_984_cov_518.432905_g3202_i0:47-928(-)
MPNRPKNWSPYATRPLTAHEKWRAKGRTPTIPLLKTLFSDEIKFESKKKSDGSIRTSTIPRRMICHVAPDQHVLGYALRNSPNQRLYHPGPGHNPTKRLFYKLHAQTVRLGRYVQNQGKTEEELKTERKRRMDALILPAFFRKTMDHLKTRGKKRKLQREAVNIKANKAARKAAKKAANKASKKKQQPKKGTEASKSASKPKPKTAAKPKTAPKAVPKTAPKPEPKPVAELKGKEKEKKGKTPPQSPELKPKKEGKSPSQSPELKPKKEAPAQDTPPGSPGKSGKGKGSATRK